MLNILTTFTAVLFWFQERNTAIEMADKLRENGKIYVVVAVIAIILIGIITYLITLDKKISKLEKK